jgi:hypothetical protein
VRVQIWRLGWNRRKFDTVIFENGTEFRREFGVPITDDMRGFGFGFIRPAKESPVRDDRKNVLEFGAEWFSKLDELGPLHGHDSIRLGSSERKMWFSASKYSSN